jgi:putative FmdB family regulatory protein
MPVYEYHCTGCDETFEQQRKFSDSPLEVCSLCGEGPVEKLISRSSFALKGSGWYQSDYGSKNKDSAPKAPSCGGGSKPACAGCPSASE